MKPVELTDPTPFKKALRYLIGGRYEHERQPVFVRFLKKCLAAEERERREFPDRFRFQPKRESHEIIAQLKETGVPLRSMLVWRQIFPEWRKQDRSQINRENAQKRWPEKKKLARHVKRRK
jgi:hypothetical protein